MKGMKVEVWFEEAFCNAEEDYDYEPIADKTIIGYFDDIASAETAAADYVNNLERKYVFIDYTEEHYEPFVLAGKLYQTEHQTEPTEDSFYELEVHFNLVIFNEKKIVEKHS